MSSHDPDHLPGGTDGTDPRVQKLIGEYLRLVDAHGVTHRQTQEFLAAHRDEAELREWAAVVAELDGKGRTARPTGMTRLARPVRAAAVVALVLAGGYGVAAAARTAQLEDALGSARTELAQARSAHEGAQAALGTARAEVASARADAGAARADAQTARADATRAQDALRRERADYARALADVGGTAGRDRDAFLRELAALSRENAKLALDRKKYLDELGLVRGQLAALRDDRDRANPERTTVLIAATSRVAAGDEYPAAVWRAANRVFPPRFPGTPGVHYARAALLDLAGDGPAYRTELQFVPRESRWAQLASAEARAGESAVELASLAADLLARSTPDPDTDPKEEAVFEACAAVVQREVAVRSLVRAYAKSDRREAWVAPVVEQAAKPDRWAHPAAAAELLGAVGPAWAGDPRPAVAALVKGLGHREAAVRWHAARALGEFGPAAAPARDALRGLHADPDPFVRQQAARALRRVDPAARER